MCVGVHHLGQKNGPGGANSPGVWRQVAIDWWHWQGQTSNGACANVNHKCNQVDKPAYSEEASNGLVYFLLGNL